MSSSLDEPSQKIQTPRERTRRIDPYKHSLADVRDRNPAVHDELVRAFTAILRENGYEFRPDLRAYLAGTSQHQSIACTFHLMVEESRVSPSASATGIVRARLEKFLIGLLDFKDPEYTKEAKIRIFQNLMDDVVRICRP